MSLRLPTMPPDRADAVPPPAPRSTLRQIYDANVGLVLLSSAQFFFACMAISVKFLLSSTAISTMTVIWVRMAITSSCCVAVLLASGDANPVLGPPGVRRILALRGVCGWLGLTAAYQSLRGLSVSDGATIGFLGPTATALVGYAWLGEKMTAREAGAGLASLLGVVLVSRPAFLFGNHAESDVDVPPEEGVWAFEGAEENANLRAISVCWSFIGVLCGALAYTSIRYIGDRANALHSINYFAMMCCIGSGIGMWATGVGLSQVHTLRDFLLVVLIGTFGFLAQALVTLGLQREKAGRGALATYLQIFFALALEFAVFGTTPSLLSVAGIAIILTSAVYTAVSAVPKPRPQPTDAESQPLSRSPSPLPTGRTLRGGHYSYAAVEPEDPNPLGLGGNGKNAVGSEAEPSQ
ncbi:hypothetical protein Q5752_001027 [Cryptotrichosporon argae]